MSLVRICLSQIVAKCYGRPDLQMDWEKSVKGIFCSRFKKNYASLPVRESSGLGSRLDALAALEHGGLVFCTRHHALQYISRNMKYRLSWNIF